MSESPPRLVRLTAFALALALPASFGVGLGAAPAHAAGTAVLIDGLTSKAPDKWKETPSNSSMRLKQFTVPKEKGDQHDAEVVIFFFGPGQGGGADANITRWKGMFEAPAGKTIDELSKIDTKTVGKVKTTTLDVRGTYKYKASMMAPGDPELRPNYRMIAVVFESPNGPYFFRLVGPERTVERNKKDFDKWIGGFK